MIRSSRQSISDTFIHDHPLFSLKETVAYPNGGKSFFHVSKDICVILDDDICDIKRGEKAFSYMLITDKQNQYMNAYKSVYRFLGYRKSIVDAYLNEDKTVINAKVKNTYDRNESSDVSPLESEFEDSFTDVYGMGSLRYLSREYGVTDSEGNTYYIDYEVRTTHGQIGIEENGSHYHHPQLIGAERYERQLHKQNTCTLWRIKLYRFSLEDLCFRNRMEDDIRTFLGRDTSDFIEEGITVDRSFRLYEHQIISLEDLKKARAEGIRSFLIVLPTASGKSRIAEEDLYRFFKEHPDMKALILAPNVNIVEDWEKRISVEFPLLKDHVTVTTYSWMEIHYTEFSQDKYSYICVDEAHHAVAPALKRVIRYFTPDFLLGMTATDQRPDRKKLEDIFGSYKTLLSLREAMEKHIVATANVYRIETNLDLSRVRFNGKDYVNADLEKTIRVTSRNEIIADVISKYFTEGAAGKRQGVIFCVNVRHCREMSQVLRAAGISAESYTKEDKNPDNIMRRFKNGEIRFLCACNMISEGWDYPELGILVMARPTMSKMLYLQQIGRGLRKTDVKKNVFIIDVVDEYGSMTMACSMHSIFANPCYVPFGDITKQDYKPGDLIEIDGICERVEKVTQVEVGTFEDKYGDFLSEEQLAREYFVSTGTVTNWIKKGKIIPSVTYPFGSRKIYLFSPESVEKYRKELNLKVHNSETIKDDFFSFLEERDYSLSYKMPFMLGLIRHVNTEGDAGIDDILTDYIAFYQDRLKRGLPVDRKSCPYNEETLKDRKSIKRSMLTNPFEKFERKRFLYYSKDLGMISVNHSLWSKMTDQDWRKVKEQMQEDLRDYYQGIS